MKAVVLSLLLASGSFLFGADNETKFIGTTSIMQTDGNDVTQLFGTEG